MNYVFPFLNTMQYNPLIKITREVHMTKADLIEKMAAAIRPALARRLTELLRQ
jgi:hypothetical protein